jgi:hypothetical protein
VTDALFNVEAFEAAVERPDVLSANNNAGTTAEIAFLKEASFRGWSTWVPIGHAHKADVCIWRPPVSPLTIQIKKGVWQKDRNVWKVMVGAGKPSCAANPKDYGKRYTRYAKGDFDVLAMYVQEKDKFVLWRLQDLLEQSSVNWRPGSGPSSDNWEILDALAEPPTANR